MSPDDARLCLERHATSKIAAPTTSRAIATLGFRGEALPSIASVSHFTLRTRARGSTAGTESGSTAGAVESVAEVGVPEARSIEVADLFFNLPARRKFLKSDAAEAAQVSRMVTQLALCHPRVGFTLTSAGRQVLPVSAGRDRWPIGCIQIYGDRPDLVVVSREAARRAGSPASSPPWPTRARRAARSTSSSTAASSRDQTIAHAILDAYSVASVKERSPEVHLFLEVPPDRDRRQRPSDQGGGAVQRTSRWSTRSCGGPSPRARARRRCPELRCRPRLHGGAAVSSPWDRPRHGQPGRADWTYAAAPLTAGVVNDESGPYDTRPPAGTPETAADPATGGLARTADVPLGQFRNTFIVAVDDEGICIIDQHVAHERVLFERIRQRLTTGRSRASGCCVPMVLDLPAPATRPCSDARRTSARFGFEVEDFGGVEPAGARRCRRCSRRRISTARCAPWPTTSTDSTAGRAPPTP